jgi:hypothetical protein
VVTEVQGGRKTLPKDRAGKVQNWNGKTGRVCVPRVCAIYCHSPCFLSQSSSSKCMPSSQYLTVKTLGAQISDGKVLIYFGAADPSSLLWRGAVVLSFLLGAWNFSLELI